MLTGKPAQRTPTGPLAVHYCARLAGVSIDEYTSDPAALADSVVRYWEKFEPDAVWLSADTWVSAQAMGRAVGPPGENQPWSGLGRPLIRTSREIDRIPRPDPSTQGRYPVMIEALGRILDALGDEVFVVACFDQYPFSLASELLGINETMLKLLEDPPLVEALMERCLEYGLAYGKALGEAGAHLLSGGDSPAGLIGPRSYREIALPYEKRLIAGLKEATRRPVSLHICGDSTSILEDMAASGAEVLEIDHKVDISRACRLIGPEIALWGNLDPVGVLARGNPSQVLKAAGQVLDAVRASGHTRFVLSSGCTLALETPAANLEALLRAPAQLP